MIGYFIYCNKSFRNWDLFESKMKQLLTGKNLDTFTLFPGVLNLKSLNNMLTKFHYWYQVNVKIDEFDLENIEDSETIIFESKEDGITKQLKKYFKKNHLPYQIYKV